MECFLYALPILFGFIIVYLFGVDVLYWDDWLEINFIDNALKNGISLTELIKPHGEHRLIISKIILAINAALSHMNTKTLMYLGQLMISIVYLLIVHYVKLNCKDKIRSDEKNKLALVLLLGFCCFNIVQWECFLWGFPAIEYGLVQLFSVPSFYFFYRWYQSNKISDFIISMCLSLAAVLSDLHGLYIFPTLLCVIALILISGGKIKVQYILSIVCMLLLTFAVYFIGVPLGRGFGEFKFSLLKIFLYFLAAQGSPLIVSEKQLLGILGVAPALVAGIAISAAWISLGFYLVANKKIKSHIFPLCLILFGIIFCASIAIARSNVYYYSAQATGFNEDWRSIVGSLASHYTPTSLCIVIGLVIIVYTEFISGRQTGKFRKVSVYGLSVLALMVLLQNIDVFPIKKFADDRRTQREVYRTYMDHPLEVLQRGSGAWADIEEARKAIELVKKNRWSFFADGQS
jgi:hypothetical protein